MRKSFSNIALVAGIVLALALIFGCSDGDNDNSGISFNENSQVYYAEDDRIFGGNFIIGDTYTGGGTIEIYGGPFSASPIQPPPPPSFESNLPESYNGTSIEQNRLIAGNVINGIVKFELPKNIPNEYLYDFLNEKEKGSCTSYPKDIKMFGGQFVLTNSDGENLGRLSISSNDGNEGTSYMYFSKAGKITCNIKHEEDITENNIMNMDVKEGWNQFYARETRSEDGMTETNEISTTNILTKEMKWLLIH